MFVVCSPNTCSDTNVYFSNVKLSLMWELPMFGFWNLWNMVHSSVSSARIYVSNYWGTGPPQFSLGTSNIEYYTLLSEIFADQLGFCFFPLKLVKILHCWNRNNFWIAWIVFICYLYTCFLFGFFLEGQVGLNVSSDRFISWSVFWGGSACKYEIMSFRNMKRLFINSQL